MALPRIVAALRAFARAASIFPVAVGILVLIGWWGDIDVLRRIVSGLVAMNPATAIGFICLGLSLAAQTRVSVPPRVGQTLLSVPAFVALLIGLIKIAALVTPWNLGIDQI